jgi:hypothetical protein
MWGRSFWNNNSASKVDKIWLGKFLNK